MAKDIYDFLEKWDLYALNWAAWTEWMREAVLTYNEAHDTSYNPDATIAQYVSMKRKEHYEE